MSRARAARRGRPRSREMRRVAARLLAPALLLAASGSGLSAQDTHLVLVTGLGGDPAYSESFHAWASTLRRGAVEAGVRPERIHWLGEDPSVAPELLAGRSTLENLRSHLELLAGAAGRDDRVLLVLIGHGTARGDEARFNLPGPDLTGAGLADLLEAFGSRTVAVVNTAPSSGPWVGELAGPGRVVITATRSAAERNETQFGRYFAEAFGGEEADFDKDERVSLLEAFRYAVRQVERHYGEQNLLVTEHAVLDDEERAEGFFLTPRLGVRAGSPEADVPPGVTDPALRALYQERAALERRVGELRDRRDAMEADAYEARLEELLVELALKTREIREREGGGT